MSPENVVKTDPTERPDYDDDNQLTAGLSLVVTNVKDVLENFRALKIVLISAVNGCLLPVSLQLIHTIYNVLLKCK